MNDHWYYDDDDDDDDDDGDGGGGNKHGSAMICLSPPISQLRDYRCISLFILQFDWLSAKESE